MKQSMIVMCLCVVACIAGCHPGSSDARINTATGVQSDTLANNIITRPIGNFVSFMAGEGIEITNVIDRVKPNGFLEVQVEGYNHAKGRRIFDYRVEWLDRDGMQVRTVMTQWAHKSVMPESSFIIGPLVAPSRQATDFRINTRVNKTMK